MGKGEGEGGEGESVVRNTDEAIIYTLILLTYTVWSGMRKGEGRGERGIVWLEIQIRGDRGVKL